ncbi:hypothetical protein D9M69_698840 [compost metagenome]
MAPADPVARLGDKNVGHVLFGSHFSFGKLKVFRGHHPVTASIHHHRRDREGFPDRFYSPELFNVRVFFERSSDKTPGEKPAQDGPFTEL